jgi:hypothetical protein
MCSFSLFLEGRSPQENIEAEALVLRIIIP